jgi:hypothetical protein
MLWACRMAHLWRKISSRGLAIPYDYFQPNRLPNRLSNDTEKHRSRSGGNLQVFLSTKARTHAHVIRSSLTRKKGKRKCHHERASVGSRKDLFPASIDTIPIWSSQKMPKWLDKMPQETHCVSSYMLQNVKAGEKLGTLDLLATQSSLHLSLVKMRTCDGWDWRSPTGRLLLILVFFYIVTRTYHS